MQISCNSYPVQGNNKHQDLFYKPLQPGGAKLSSQDAQVSVSIIHRSPLWLHNQTTQDMLLQKQTLAQIMLSSRNKIKEVRNMTPWYCRLPAGASSGAILSTCTQITHQRKEKHRWPV